MVWYKEHVKEKGNLDLSKIYPMLEQASANSVVWERLYVTYSVWHPKEWE